MQQNGVGSLIDERRKGSMRNNSGEIFLLGLRNFITEKASMGRQNERRQNVQQIERKHKAPALLQLRNLTFTSPRPAESLNLSTHK